MRNGWDILAPLSLVYGAATSLRNLAYDSGMRKAETSSVPIISVGNLTAGGTGKTPVTISLVTELGKIYKDGVFTVVSRGYGRASRGVKIVSNRNEILLDARLAGDEPTLIATSLPGTPVVVSEKRSEGIRLANRFFQPRAIVLDDAFQHRSAIRDLDIVLLDPSIPSWHWRWLPAGRLRESPKGLKRADLVILRDNTDKARIQALTQWIRKYSDVPVLRGQLSPVDIAPVGRTENKPGITISAMRTMRIAAASGIAYPQRFYHTLQQLGINPVHSTVWKDHADLNDKLLHSLLKQATSSSAEAILITEKDAVKWPAMFQSSIPVYSLRMKWVWTNGLDILQTTVKSLID